MWQAQDYKHIDYLACALLLLFLCHPSDLAVFRRKTPFRSSLIFVSELRDAILVIYADIVSGANMEHNILVESILERLVLSLRILGNLLLQMFRKHAFRSQATFGLFH